MKRAIVVVAVLCALFFIVAPHGQPVLSLSPTQVQIINVMDPCSGFTAIKSSAAVAPGVQQAVVVGVSGKVTYVCGFELSAFTSNNTGFSHGTSTQCSSGSGTALASQMVTSTQTAPVVVGNNGQTVLVVPSGDDLCSNGGGGGFVTYVQQ